MPDLGIGDDITETIDENKRWFVPESALAVKVTCITDYLDVYKGNTWVKNLMMVNRTK